MVSLIIHSNSKINLGLWVTNKRSDGYHDLETVMYPLTFLDTIELHPDYSDQNRISIQTKGHILDIPPQENLIFKAYQLLVKRFTKLPSLKVTLWKKIPAGSGLGGGSANATFFIVGCNELFKLGMNNFETKSVCKAIGSDCSYFLFNKPALALGRGDLLKPVPLDLSKYCLLVVCPNIRISTNEAFKLIRPKTRKERLEEIICLPVSTWRDQLQNDFENVIFQRYPSLERIKNSLYENGATYASMSGTGSSVYGIFETIPDISVFKNYTIHVELPRDANFQKNSN
ncbi:MAG: 4-(cytidine 5'-diphospho)-2-C-methyl-D-erythritol kinase [Deltaproteobacteria bacterium]|nr:4-(cytidine 5'-diphospho)-2-C-methyl-D-erythritol kinase [Deltaproteobacteria bacterium]